MELAEEIAMQAKGGQIAMYILGSLVVGCLFRIGWEIGGRVWAML